MTKKHRLLLLVVFSFWLLGSLGIVRDGIAEQQKNFLWKVQSKTTTVYVFGSIHFLKPENYPLNPTIEKAFERSSILGVEANINDPGKIDLQTLMDRALYGENDSLEKHLSREAFQYAEKETAKLGLPIALVQRQRPWHLALTLESLELMRLGFDPQYGIDVHFLSKADAGKKRIVALESLDEQINLVSGLSESDQELFLLFTLRNLNILNRYMNDLVKVWMEGDTKTVESILMQSVREEPKLAPVLRKLLDERNTNMVSKVEGYLRTREIHFIVVGAGHLVGDKGIINGLRERGYSIEQL